MRKEDGFPGQISFVLPDKIISTMKENSMISGLYLTDIGYYPHARYHFRKRPTGSSQYILIYCVEGKGEIRLNEITHLVPPDHFFIIPAGTPHSYHSEELNPWTIYWVHFSGSRSEFYTRYSCQPIPIDRGTTSRINDREDFFTEIFRNLDRGFSIETLEYVNLCLPHLLASFTHLSQFCLIKESGEKDPVEKSINFMLEHLKKKLKLEEIALETSLSVSHYSRIFQNRTGHSPIEYFNQLKIQRACRLLDNSGWMVGDVSREMGFEDQFYFSRVFHKVMGMSPAKYRKRRL